MKMVKSLILGSAAGLLAMSGAQAADLPVKAKAVEYVKICSLYGAGFYYIPGTDTCIKLGGYLRVDVGVQRLRRLYGGTVGGNYGQRNRFRNYFLARSREDLTSIRAPRPSTAWSAPSSMRRSAGPLRASTARRPLSAHLCAGQCRGIAGSDTHRRLPRVHPVRGLHDG